MEIKASFTLGFATLRIHYDGLDFEFRADDFEGLYDCISGDVGEGPHFERGDTFFGAMTITQAHNTLVEGI